MTWNYENEKEWKEATFFLKLTCKLNIHIKANLVLLRPWWQFWQAALAQSWGEPLIFQRESEKDKNRAEFIDCESAIISLADIFHPLRLPAGICCNPWKTSGLHCAGYEERLFGSSSPAWRKRTPEQTVHRAMHFINTLSKPGTPDIS